jgi:hypothetical protein
MLDAKPLSFRDASQIFQPRSGDRLQPTAQAVGGTRESPSGAKKKAPQWSPTQMSESHNLYEPAGSFTTRF